jgi:hypothetical protein
MRFSSAGLCLLAVCCLLLTITPASAQRAKKKKEPPKPEKIDLRTKDGVDLRAYYFGSTEGKAAIPVMLIHEWDGQIAPYGSLCLALQKAGCAVLAFDYRGHGGSLEYVDRSGQTNEFNRQTMSKRDIANIIQYDLEAGKRFLKQKNNDGELNLNALVVIGIREGSVLAAAWAQRDWKFPSVGSRKQGQDVKGLVMVSPERTLMGLTVEMALKDPRVAALPTLIVVGQGSPEASDAERIYKRIGVMKRRIRGGQDPEGLELLTVRERLGGPNLINQSSAVIPGIVKFIKEEIEITDTINPWIERE